MRVWLLHIGEQLPVDGRTRPFRYGYLATTLQEAGHDVLRWAPTFSHVNKTHRYLSDHRVSITSDYTIQFVHSPGYRRNAGLERLRAYRVLGQRFRQLSKQAEPPDLIVAAIPSLEWAQEAIRFGRKRGVPVVIDIRDLWPDVFLNAVPSAARPVGRLALAPYRKMARRACEQAHAITAVSQSYLDWGLRLARRSQQPQDLVVPLGYEPEQAPAEAMEDCLTRLRNRGIDPARPICMFAGLFERSYDLETVVEAARRLRAGGRKDVQIVLCGDGTKLPSIKRLAGGIENIHLLGWVDATMLAAVASVSSIGLCTYTRDAFQSLPNKPFEYMASRLAIVSSLTGELAELLDDHKCGLTYRAGDAESLKHSLLQLVDNPQQLTAMRRNAYQAWKADYRSSSVYARFAEHLATLKTTEVQLAASAGAL